MLGGEVYLEPSQIFKMEHCAKEVNDKKPLFLHNTPS